MTHSVYHTFCVVKRDEVKKFLDHLNGIHPTIKFTFELEKEGSLPILDALLTR